MQSDDFNACALQSGRWQWIDPLGDATLTLNGQQAVISVPAGRSHDVWTAGNGAPRLMQTVENGDFTVELKFDSVVSQQYQMQGVLVEQDAQNFLRINFQSDGQNTILFVASFVNGSPTVLARLPITTPQAVYLRVQRTGERWAIRYAGDSSTWQSDPKLDFTRTMIVRGVGLFVGNVGRQTAPAPAYTGLIDYFFNTATPITPEDGIAIRPAVRVVGAGTVTLQPEQASYLCGSSLTLTAQSAEGTNFVGWSGNLTGATNPAVLTVDAGQVITATFAPVTGHTLNVQKEGEGEVQADPPGPHYLPGQVVTLQASPVAGWSFAGWLVSAGAGNTVIEEPNATIHVTMPDSRVYTARFTRTQGALFMPIVMNR